MFVNQATHLNGFSFQNQYQQQSMAQMRTAPAAPQAFDLDNLQSGPLPFEHNQYQYNSTQVQDPFSGNLYLNKGDTIPQSQVYVDDNAVAPELPFTAHPPPSMTPMSNKFRQSLVIYACYN